MPAKDYFRLRYEAIKKRPESPRKKALTKMPTYRDRFVKLGETIDVEGNILETSSPQMKEFLNHTQIINSMPCYEN